MPGNMFFAIALSFSEYYIKIDYYIGTGYIFREKTARQYLAPGKLNFP
jgi:hypothetical protein